MNRRVLIVFVGLLVLGIGFLASAESKTFTWTATLTIPAVLEVLPSEKELDLSLTPGTTAATSITLSVGTNCWPLELYLGLLPAQETGPSFTFMYRLHVKAQAPPPLWVEIPAFSLASPLNLTSPAWTTYTLSIRVTAPEDTIPGKYLQVLRLRFLSSSGLVETRDLPINVVVR